MEGSFNIPVNEILDYSCTDIIRGINYQDKLAKMGWSGSYNYTNFNSYFNQRYKITRRSFSQNVFLQRCYLSYIKFEENVIKKDKNWDFKQNSIVIPAKVI